MLSAHKVNECQELEGRLGIKLEEFEIKNEEDECDGNENNSLSLVDPSMILSEDAEIKPVIVDASYNPETNHTAIERGPYQNASEIKMEHPNGRRVRSIKDVKGTVYNCKLCPYKAKSKRYLLRHTLVHKDISEVESYQCTTCPFKTKWKRNLIQHTLVHKEASEVTIYQCDSCCYNANCKRYLNQHMLTHKDISEVTAYRCELCPYRTKWKKCLAEHMQNHRVGTEVMTYDCKFCSYKAKGKGYLKRHMLTHKDTSEDAKSAQTQQKSTSEHQELEGCSTIKSEEVDIKDEEDEYDVANKL